MVSKKSLDQVIGLIAASLCDIQLLHSEVFTPRAKRLTVQKIVSRIEREGISFLTKTLPRLGKMLDRALAGQDTFDSASLGFKPQPNSKLPKLFGELFNLVLSPDGRVLQRPCVSSIRSLRLILFVYYKYNLPYDSDTERKVIDQFIQTEQELTSTNELFCKVAETVDQSPTNWSRVKPLIMRKTLRRARRLLWELFRHFDPYNIQPRHGPGSVATRETLWDKYSWTVVPNRLTDQYPFDAYFCASLGHVCDEFPAFSKLGDGELSARVLLVPKDSRGPRLISCEPLAFQWIQQGLGDAIVKHVEHHPLTTDNVHFSNQQPNQFGALLGSQTGRYATLDLKEASDRVTVGLVRLLFPEPLLKCLLAARSQSTLLPNGSTLQLNKFAPMGSALCFPVLALTIWAVLTAGIEDAESRERLLVYGDDVIVPTAQAENAIALLESVGLLCNRDKSCVHGLFRESCGVDAYQGSDVTPVRIRTEWQHHQSPKAYVSWIAYANHFYERQFFTTYEFIVSGLCGIYRTIPERNMLLACPALYEVPECYRPKRRRQNFNLQKLEYRVLDVRSHPIHHEMQGWKMLLRFFSEGSRPCPVRMNDKDRSPVAQSVDDECRQPFSVGLYTKRDTSNLVWCWR